MPKVPSIETLFRSNILVPLYLPSLEACCDGRRSLHRREPGRASVLATKIEACSKCSLKKQLNKLQKESESAFFDRGVGAEIGLYYKKDGTWECCVIHRVHAQVNHIRVEAGLQVENV